MNLRIAVLTAWRPKPTLARSLASLEASGACGYRIYADAHSDPAQWGKVTTCAQVVIQTARLGIFRQARLALADLVDGADGVALLQDDAVYCRGLWAYLARDLWPAPDTGAVSLYLPARYTRATPHGWIRVSQGNAFQGAVALVLTRPFVELLLNDGRLETWAARQSWGFDNCVGEALADFGLAVHCASPSLADHIDAPSAIWTGRLASRRAPTFVGEEYDVDRARADWPRRERFGR